MADGDPGLLRKQLMGGIGAVAAMAIVAIAWVWAPQLLAFVSLPADDRSHRLAFVAQWLIIPGLTLLVGIFGAARRGFFADAIEGTRAPASWGLEINLRYNQNTIEQVVLAAIAWLGLSISLPHAQLIAIPAAAILFGIGRIAFWVGYLIHPMARAFGMAMTVIPTLAAFAWLVAHHIA